MTVETLKNTALSQMHLALGAKMVPYAGYQMPLRYTGGIEEHLQVRKNVGVFDVSHMAEFRVKGKDALKLIQWISSNDASVLNPGKVQYACLVNEKGGIVDDFLLYQIAAEEYMLVLNASNREKDWEWIENNNKWNVELSDVTDQITLLAVQGPKAKALLQPLVSSDLNEIPYYTFRHMTFAGVDNVLVSATGYTGAGGFELYLGNANAEKVWRAIFETGEQNGIDVLPIGLGARDTLRMEMGFCLYGNDIDENRSTLEAGLGWITKLKKDFIGADVLRRQKEVGIKQKLVGLKLLGKGIPRKGYAIHSEHGNDIGLITSGTMSPSLNTPIGMAYIDLAFAKAGTRVYLSIRDKQIEAEVVKFPFIEKNS